MEYTKHLIQYRCTVEGCFHEESLITPISFAPPICCKKHRELPTMKVFANVPIRIKEETNANTS